MQKIIKELNVSFRILMFILIVSMLLVAKSIALILFLTTLSIVFTILLDKSVKDCIDIFKSIGLWLLFVLLVYIIIFSNVLGSLLFLYKIIICVIYAVCLFSNVKFDSLDSGINTIIYPLSRMNIDIDKISFNMTLGIFLVLYYFQSYKIIFDKCKKYNLFMFDIKHYFLSRLLLASSKSEELKSNLILKFYKVKNEKIKRNEYVVLLVTVIMFFIVLFKEVIF